MDATTRTVERRGDGMSYRKHLMPNISPSAVYEATAVDSDTDTISRQQAIDAISCDITITGRRNAEIVSETIASFVDRIKALPPAQPVIVPCDYVKACNAATMDKPTSAVLYLDVLEELKKHGYVLVDMREARK